MKKIISIVLALALVLSLTACGGFKLDSQKDFSVIANADIKGDLKGEISAEGGSVIEISFPEKTSFDTVVIEEADGQVFHFSILIKDENGEFVEVYKQDYIGDYRYCSIGEHSTDALQIRIDSANENQYKIDNIDVLNVKDNKNNDLRVTSYLVCEWFYGSENVDTDKLQSITDIILFGIARFNENGEIYYQSLEKNGEAVDGKTVLLDIIKILKSTNPSLNIYCNILGPDGADADDKERLHSQAFIDNGDKLASNINILIKDLNADGIFFDYEYPYSNKSIKDYSKFLVGLDSVIGEYKIGVALSHWNCNLSKDAINVIDQVEIMSYDDMQTHFDQHGDFYSYGGILAIESFEEKGYDLSKCDLGLPFYGRTHNGDEAWPSYAQIAEDLDENPFMNVISKSYMTGETVGKIVTSFNGVQMIKDKTAFANDYGLGGVMVWHYTCDVPYESDMSLFKAVQDSLNTRN